LDRNRPDVPTDDNLAEFMSIEQGVLLTSDSEVERSEQDRVEALRIRDSAGTVEVVARVYVNELDSANRAVLSVTSSHSGVPTDRLNLTASLLNFRTGKYEPIGMGEVIGGAETISRFAAQLDVHRSYVGRRGEVRIRLSVSAAEPASIGSGFTYAIAAIDLRCPLIANEKDFTPPEQPDAMLVNKPDNCR